MHHPSIVDNNIQTTEFTHARCHRLLPILLLCRVAFKADGYFFTNSSIQVISDTLAIFWVNFKNENPGAFFDEFACDAFA